MSTLNDIWILYRREVRAAFRERTIVVNSILLPIVLYPVLLWAMFNGFLFVQGQTEGFVSRVAITGLPDAHRQLQRDLARDDRVRIEGGAVADAAGRIRAGTLDALIEFLPPSGSAGASLPDNVAIRLTFNESRERSAAARHRVEGVVETYRGAWLQKQATARGVPAAAWQVFTLESRNVATGRQVGSFLLSMLLPIIFVIMVAIGCLHPAIDATAGERERGTWETLLSTAATRRSIVISKYLYVTSFGTLAGLLNMGAMLASLKPIIAPLAARAGETISFAAPLASLPVFALAAVLLAAFVAAGMMIFAAFARTFKEGQAMVTPFYLLIVLPAMFLQVPGLEFTPGLALIPVINVALMVRAAVSENLHLVPCVLTIVSSAVTVAFCLWIAGTLLSFEDIVVGSYTGNFTRFFKERLAPRRAGARNGAAR
jgi:sodium transport system permease protein